MINLKVQVSGDKAIINGLKKLAAGLRKEGLSVCADAALASILKRTLAGKDENDRAMRPLKRQGSTLLSDTGKMLASMRVQSVTASKAVIGFGGRFEAQKAWWQQHGTKPYPMRPKSKGGVMAWKTGGGWAYSRGHRHPGLPARPFFGISRQDEMNIQRAADKFLARTIAESGL